MSFRAERSAKPGPALPEEISGERTWIEISASALLGNYRAFKNLVAPGTGVAAVVKADAYGHCPMIGRICMDMCRVDISHRQNADIINDKQASDRGLSCRAGQPARVGNIVTIIGTDGGDTISAEQIANRISAINYEFVTRLGQHLPRHLT